VNTLLGAVVKQMDLLLLGWLRGPADAGYYRLAKSLAATLGLLVGPLQNATYPRFARLAGLGRDAELRAVARRAAVRVGLPLGAAVIVALPLVPTVVAAAVGETFLPAARAAQVVLAGGAAWLAGFWVRPYLMAAGRIRTFTHLYVASLVPYAVGVALLARTWGATGMAIGFLGHNVVLFLLPAVGLLR